MFDSIVTPNRRLKIYANLMDANSLKVTRRTIARLLAISAVVPAPAPAQDRPQDPRGVAREQFDRNEKAMAAVKIPMPTEPPFHFRA